MNYKYYTESGREPWSLETIIILNREISNKRYKCKECGSRLNLFNGYHSLICNRKDLNHDSGYRVISDFINFEIEPKIVSSEETDIKQYDIYLKNKNWIEELIKDISIDEFTKKQPFPRWFTSYKKFFSGKDVKKVFAKNVIVFEATLFPAYTGYLEKPDGSVWNGSIESFMCFAEYMNSFKEADRYFKTIDSVTPCS